MELQGVLARHAVTKEPSSLIHFATFAIFAFFAVGSFLDRWQPSSTLSLHDQA